MCNLVLALSASSEELKHQNRMTVTQDGQCRHTEAFPLVQRFQVTESKSCATMTKQSKCASHWKVYSCCKWEHLLCTLFAKGWNTFSCFSCLYYIDIELYSAHLVLKMPLSPHPGLEEAACTSASTTAETVRSLSSACFTQAQGRVPFSFMVTDFGV